MLEYDLNQHFTSNIWLMIPARGGSKGIPRKNLRLLGGLPLIVHSLQTMSRILDKNHLIVSTDDSAIAHVSEPYAMIHHRSAELSSDKANLDEVTVGMLEWLLEQGASPDDIILTVQPTSPFISTQTIIQGVEKLEAGASSVISVYDDRHLRWTVDEQGQPQPLYKARVNRQWLPSTYAETGGLFGTHIKTVLETKTRINPPIDLVIIDRKEGLDIDDYSDWAVAEFQMSRLKVLIRADAGVNLGMGHVYRAIALAQELSSHELVLATRSDDSYALGANFLQKHPYNIHLLNSEDEFQSLVEDMQPDILLLDILDTDGDYIQNIRQTPLFLVTLEDLGTGAHLADIVINDLYSDLYPKQNHWYGVENSILSPYFEIITPKENMNPQVENILITFGGSDPKNLTLKALQALEEIRFKGNVIVVLGPGYQHDSFSLYDFKLNGQIMKSVANMAELARNADLALTSGGRTVTEMMALGIPTMVLCQNSRELRHTHASSVYGVINLGLGEYVDVSSIAQHIEMLVQDTALRESMRQRGINALQQRSNQRIVERILEAAKQ